MTKAEAIAAMPQDPNWIAMYLLCAIGACLAFYVLIRAAAWVEDTLLKRKIGTSHD